MTVKNEDPCHSSTEGNPSETITGFIDYALNPTTALQLPMDMHTYKTKHATEISRVIGTTDELKKFDELRHRIKQSKHKRSPELKIHDCLLTSIKTKVLRERSLAMKKISEEEHRYFHVHGTLPSEDANTDIAALMSKQQQTNFSSLGMCLCDSIFDVVHVTVVTGILLRLHMYHSTLKCPNQFSGVCSHKMMCLCLFVIFVIMDMTKHMPSTVTLEN